MNAVRFSKSMPGVTVVVCGQYGSTGKGKCVVRIVQRHGCALAIRSGGPNAGHTVYVNGNQKYVTRLLPSALAVPGVQLAIAAGGMVDIQLLEKELTALEGMGIKDIRQRLWIDPFASIVETGAGDAEIGLKLGQSASSTLTGTGWTQAQRALRQARIARDILELRPHMHDVTLEANRMVDAGKHVIIEGTQGFGLSVYHGGFYPQCTSRDTSAAGFVSECGLSPRLVGDIWMVVRTFPIRVGGNSGPMWSEVNWDFIREHAGFKEPLVEMTSVTKKVRRVGLFDWGLLARATMVNRPTKLAVHGLDYLNAEDQGKKRYDDLSERSKGWLRELQLRSKVPVGMAFTGPHQNDLVDDDTGAGILADDMYDGNSGARVRGDAVRWSGGS